MDILDSLLKLFVNYGYWAVFFGVMLENAGLPVPGETILLAAGFFAATGHFKLTTVMLVAATGAVVGDNVGFAIGHHYGRGFLLRYGRFIFLTPARLEHINGFFERHGNKTILVARFITGLRVFAALLAGASKMRWRVFLVYNMVGAILWSIVITTLGYLFGNSWPLLERWVGRSGLFMLLALVVALLIVWRVREYRKAEKAISTTK
ncbi:MAG TPA: DedA family protein [Pyrinomonadaceae bacterium]|jgi:membrane protein DedA with SNARE-associated domain|nr:DedA family protein [Pyrinomonadaceae bacterium]